MDRPRKNLHDLKMAIVNVPFPPEPFYRTFVMTPPAVLMSALRHPLLSGLCVQSAGYFPRARGHRVSRSDREVDVHQLMTCEAGAGWVQIGGGAVMPVKPGSVVWLPKGRRQTYAAQDDDPWTLRWVSFVGAEADAWERHLAEGEKTLPVLLTTPPERLPDLRLDQVITAVEAGDRAEHLILAAAALRVTLCEVRRMRVEGRSAGERIGSIVAALRGDPARPWRTEELAALAGLSVQHFSALFRRRTGRTPMDYLARLRVQAACRQLAATERSVGAIAADVGYGDAFYFSRRFRCVMGCSPREFRRLAQAGK